MELARPIVMANPDSERAFIAGLKTASGALLERDVLAKASPGDAASSPHDDGNGSKDATPEALRPCVLVVDDHQDTREAYADELRAAGFRTVEAENGVVALKLAHEVGPVAILLDYAMPMMDGLQAAHCLRRDPRTAHIPLVMLTAYRNLVGVRGRCDEVIDKPCDPREVVARVKDVLRRSKE